MLNNKPVECDSYLSWTMMVKCQDYTVKGNIIFTDESEYFDGDTFKGRNTSLEIERWSDDKTISVAPIMETKVDNLRGKDIEVIWKRGYIDCKLFTTSWTVYDSNHSIIESIRGYFDYNSNDSKVEEIGENYVKIKMDKGDELRTTKKQPVKVLAFEFYKREGSRRRGYEYKGPYTIPEGTLASEINGNINVRPEYEKAHADKSACNVYIPIENLVERIGEDNAKDSKLYSAKLNIQFRAVLKNAVLKRNTSDLQTTIYLERRQKGTDTWQIVDEAILNQFTLESERKTIKNDETEFNVDLEALGIKDYKLEEVNYDDELRLNIDIEYNANTEYAHINISNANIDITYGPNYEN